MFLKPTNNMSKFRYVSILGTPEAAFFSEANVETLAITSKNPIKSTSQHLDGCRGHGHLPLAVQNVIYAPVKTPWRLLLDNYIMIIMM